MKNPVVKFPSFFLLLIWLVCSAFNITKAAHIDDTIYLEIARWIVQSPLHPLSGQVNWVNTLEPISRISASPLLLPYLLAGLMWDLGDSQLAFHALMALFTGLSIAAFYRLSVQLRAPYPLLLTAAWGLSPALVPSQNLMLDVPLVAVMLCFFSVLVATSQAESAALSRLYFVAGLLAGIAPLIKYPGLTLTPLLLFHLALHRQWRQGWSLLIPVAIFGAWCAFNVSDYGSIHLLQTGSGSAHFSGLPIAQLPLRLADSLIFLGAAFPLAMLSFIWLWRGPRILAGALLALSGLTFLQSFVFQADSLVNSFLRALFVWLALSMLAALVVCASQVFGPRAAKLRAAGEVSAREVSARELSARVIALLPAWILIGWAFALLFAPFLAMRHLLPIAPALLLLTGLWIFPHFSRRAVALAVGVSALTAMVLGLADWQYANIYRVEAAQIRAQLPRRARVYFVGHWGWQWYAAQAGMRQYDLENSVLQPGDYLVVPHFVREIPISARYGPLLEPQQTIEVPATPALWVRTLKLYGGGWQQLPWTIATDSPEQFTIFKISPVPVANSPAS